MIGHAFQSDILSSEPIQLTQKLAEWLPKNGSWTICWRATSHGWGSDVFHKNCDGKIPTLTVVKVFKNGQSYVFGGYSTASWDAST